MDKGSEVTRLNHITALSVLKVILMVCRFTPVSEGVLTTTRLTVKLVVVPNVTKAVLHKPSFITRATNLTHNTTIPSLNLCHQVIIRKILMMRWKKMRTMMKIATMVSVSTAESITNSNLLMLTKL